MKSGTTIVRAGLDEQFGRESVVLGETPAPGTAMDEDVDGRVGPCGRVDVEPFDGCGAIGKAPRRAEPGTGGVAIGCVALADLRQIRRVRDLVIGGIELGLVHIEPDGRPLDPRHRWCGRLLGEQRPSGRDSNESRTHSQKIPSRQLSPTLGFPGAA